MSRLAITVDYNRNCNEDRFSREREKDRTVLTIEPKLDLRKSEEGGEIAPRIFHADGYSLRQRYTFFPSRLINPAVVYLELIGPSRRLKTNSSAGTVERRFRERAETANRGRSRAI